MCVGVSGKKQEQELRRVFGVQIRGDDRRMVMVMADVLVNKEYGFQSE